MHRKERNVTRTIDLACEMLDAIDQGALIAPPTDRFPDLTVAEAYDVAERVARFRSGRGEEPVGRKCGYTNRTIWAQYNVDSPIWHYVYRSTLTDAPHDRARLSLRGVPQPLIEPEITLGFADPVPSGLSDPTELIGHVAWIARSFEIVCCHFPGWKFRLPDSIIDSSHHARLVIGSKHPVTSGNRRELARQLAGCGVSLYRDGRLAATGTGANALGSPLNALAFLADTVGRQPEALALRSGEFASTGTLTRALPVAAGETWRTDVDGLALPPLELELVG